MVDRPTFVTKYLSIEDWHRVRSGSARFGTLSSYRGTEANGLMSDLKEGSRDEYHRIMANNVGSLNVNGAKISNSRGVRGAIRLGRSVSYNCLVYCCSIGKMSEEVHYKIRNGHTASNGEKYLANPDRLGWVVFNLDKLAHIFSRILRRTLANGSGEVKVLQGPVSYGSRDRNLHIWSENGSFFSNDNDFPAFVDTVFRKPVKFECEEEFRFVCLPSFPNLNYPNALPIIITNSEISECIVDCGKVE